MSNNTTPANKPVNHALTPVPALPWNHPDLWKGVRVGICTGCHKPHVLRYGLCFLCERDTIGYGDGVSDQGDH